VRISILFLLLVAIGCRGLPQRSPLPAAHEVTVGQLVFHSDFDLPADHRLVRELVQEREDISNTLGLTCSNEPINVYLFGDAERYREYLMRNFPSVPSRRAFFLETDTRLAVYAHWSDRVAEDLRHEVAHGYLHSVMPGLPLWVDEGLAEYFEVPRAMAGLNQPHVALLSDMAEHNGWRPNLKRLETLTDAAQMDQRDYAESWSWVYFILHSPPERREILTHYLADLRAKGAGKPLSTRLAALNAEPEGPLTQYLATLKKESAVR
jgi:Protein of unknown function (DUF1570)